MAPHHLADLGPVFGDVGVVGIAGRLDRGEVVGDELVDALHDVGDLALTVEDQRATAGEVRTRAVHAEQVREPRHGDAEVGRRFVAPERSQGLAVAPGDLHRPEEVVVAKPGGVTDDIGLVEHSVGRADAAGLDALDTGADQIDIVLLEAAKPRPVVLERAFTGGRVVGRDLRKKVGVVADLFGHEAEEEVARRLVALADGETVGVVPVGIDARAAEVDACAGPQDQKAEPATEIGEVADRPLHAVGHRLVVVRIREHPLRGSLENVQLLDLIGDRRGDLEAGGAGADECEPRAGDIDRVVPPDRMERRAVEVVDAGDVGKFRTVE